MDFAYSEDQEALRGLVRQILGDSVTHERSKELQDDGRFWDDELWAALVGSGIVGVTAPEAQGGGELGPIELSIVLEELGRHAAPVPLLPTLVSSLVIRQHGDEALCERWLAGVAESGTVLSHALAEPGGGSLLEPGARAKADGDDFLLDGRKVCVPAADRAAAFLLPAAVEGSGPRLFVVPRDADGLSVERATVINHEPVGHLQLSAVRVPADQVVGRGEAAVRSLRDTAWLGLAAVQAGVCDEAMRRTAAYLTERKQFGKPIGSMQGPQLRIADAYIDVESIKAMVLQAAWRMHERLDVEREILAAKWWAARAGDRVTHTAQHLHGGIGSDVDYPIHRFFLWSQQLANSLGGGSPLLAELGARLVADGAPPLE